MDVATLDVQTPTRIDNWRPIGQLITAIPHLIIAGALSYAQGAVAVVSWFAIVFTGSLPAGLANFQIFAMRYTLRAQLYAGFLHTTYPPFSFDMTADEPGGSPVAFSVRPALTERNRLTVGLRFIWVIPAALYAMVVSFVGALAWVAAFFAVLFTGRWPESLRSWVMKMQRVSVRLNVYASMLTDEYPRFATD